MKRDSNCIKSILNLFLQISWDLKLPHLSSAKSAIIKKLGSSNLRWRHPLTDNTFSFVYWLHESESLGKQHFGAPAFQMIYSWNIWKGMSSLDINGLL